MRALGIALACSFLLNASASAGTLTEDEIIQLRSQISELMGAFERGETKPFVEQTHDSLLALAGGQEAFARTTQQAVDQLLRSGIKFVESDVGNPTETYSAGEEEVCFVPRTSVMEIGGKRAKSITFMIAIRKRGGEWKFLDGAGLRRHPDLLYRLLPELQRGIELPLNMIEAL